MDRERIYIRLPRVLQEIAVNIEAWRIDRRRYGGGFASELEAAIERSRWSSVQLDDWRAMKLEAAFLSAQAIPFWRERFADANVRLGSSDPFVELKKLPVITKAEVKRNRTRLMHPSLVSAATWRHTSGTTGSGLVFPETSAMEWATWAVWWRYRLNHGISFREWCAYFGGRSIVPLNARNDFWRTNFVGRQVMFSGYHMSAENAPSYLRHLARSRVKWIHGYPSSLATLAAFARDNPSSLIGSLEVITTGAENLPKGTKRLLESVFRVPVVQHYGQAEGVANFSECRAGTMHVDEDFSFVEFDDAGDGGGLSVLGTSWFNPAFPLFRYQVGDTATLGPVCSCGSPWRTVSSVDGRLEDSIMLPSGALIGRLDHIFKDMVNVREAQIVQSSVTEVVVRIAKEPDFGASDEEALLFELRKRLGDELAVRVEYVQFVEREPNGKIRLVKSSLRKS